VRAKTWLPAAAALLACFAWLGFDAARRESATFDEPFHLLSGRALAAAGTLPPGQPNPPLLLRWLALPLPAAEKLAPLDLAGCLSAPRACGLNFVYGNTAAPGEMLARSRAASLALGVLLVALAGFWAYQLGGPAAGLSALGLAAFMPPLLAHAHLATADAGNALLCTAALVLLWRGARSPGAPAALAAGLACGLALAGKYTAVLLLPLSLGYLYLWGGRRLRLYAAWSCGVLAALSLGCWPLSAGDWLQTARAVSRELTAGHVTYLLGSVSSSGTWYYFPLALLLKTPLPALLLAAAGFWKLKSAGEGRERLLYLALPGRGLAAAGRLV
jgi:hypothetical protein